MKRLLIFALFSPLLYAQHGFFGQGAATGYWVDSVAGNDSNSGRNAAVPVATIAHLTSIDSSLNLPIWNLAPNGDWHEQLTVPRSYMTIQSQATIAGANLPLLDASSPITAGSWSKTAGQTVTYQQVLSDPETSPSEPDWYTSLWEKGVRCAIAHTVATVNSGTGCTYYPVSLVSGTSITLYMKASDGSNPGTNGFTYEYAAREYGLYGPNNGPTNVNIKGIKTRRSINANGSFQAWRSWNIFQLEADEGTKHNMLVSRNAYINGLLMQEAYFEGWGSAMLISYDVADITSGITILNANATCASYSGTFGCGDTGNVGAYGSHTSVLGQFDGFISCTNCNTTNIESAYGAGSSTTITFTNCNATNTRYAVQGNNAASGTLTVEGGTFSIHNSSGSYFFNSVGDTTTPRSASFDNVNITMGGPYTAITDAAAPIAISLTNSTIVPAVGQYMFGAIAASNASSTIYAHNNTVMPSSPTSTGLPVIWTFVAGVVADLDYNTLGPVLNATTPFHAGSTDYYWPAWQAAGHDVHSTLADLQAVYDFGSYPAAACPGTISNALNPGTWDLTTTALTCTGNSASFNGSTSKGTSLAGVGSSMGWAAVVYTTSWPAAVEIVGSQGIKVDWRLSSGVNILHYNGSTVPTSTPSALGTSKWYFVAATLGPSGGFAYNATSGTVSQVGTISTAPLNTSWVTSMYIGQRSDAYGPFNGQIAQVKVMNHTPTLSELQTLYNSWVTLDAGRGITLQ